jgi:hypothetical protein
MKGDGASTYIENAPDVLHHLSSDQESENFPLSAGQLWLVRVVYSLPTASVESFPRKLDGYVIVAAQNLAYGRH